jgi:molecular chaperone HscB
MNHFELFDLPVRLLTDKTGLARKYFELQKRYHPDFFGQAGAEAQAAALETSAQINKAFKILQDPDATIKYVLQWKGLLEEEEKFALPPDFLMEVMELNEEMMEAEDGNPETTAALRTKLTALQDEIYARAAPVIEGYEEGSTPIEDLQAVKTYYFQKKYLDRIWEGLAGK